MSKTQRWLVLATVSAGLLMVLVDTTVPPNCNTFVLSNQPKETR
jgi:hypothetical protein